MVASGSGGPERSETAWAERIEAGSGSWSRTSSRSSARRFASCWNARPTSMSWPRPVRARTWSSRASGRVPTSPCWGSHPRPSTAWRCRRRRCASVPSCRVIVLTDDLRRWHCGRGRRGGLPHDVHPHGGADRRDPFGASGDTLVPPDMLGQLFEGLFSQRREQRDALRLLSLLSRREQEVLRLLVDGAGNEEIGRALAISPQTARTHIQRGDPKVGGARGSRRRCSRRSRASSMHLPVPGSQAGSGGPLPLATGSSG